MDSKEKTGKAGWRTRAGDQVILFLFGMLLAVAVTMLRWIRPPRPDGIAARND